MIIPNWRLHGSGGAKLEFVGNENSFEVKDGCLIGMSQFDLEINNPDKISNASNITNNFLTRERVEFDKFKIPLASVS